MYTVDNLYRGDGLSVFEINVTDLTWLENVDEETDLCLHGKTVAKIGDETFEYNATVSATALYLLKSLTEDHLIHKGNQMLPCCGFSIYANKNQSAVDICGCPNGIDWSIIHIGDDIKILTESGNETVIRLDEYKKSVYSFVDKIEEYYMKSKPRILPKDKVDREGYLAFWNEWHRRRK